MTQGLGGAVRPAAELPAEPWLNGLGTTRVVASAATDAGLDPPWRISIAEVGDGAAFSLFPGRRRIFIPLPSGSIALQAAGTTLSEDSDGAIVFDGALAVTARVPAGTGTALNVMTTGTCRARITETVRDGRHTIDDPALGALILISGFASDEAGHACVAPAVVSPGSPVMFRQARVLEIRVTYPEQDLP